MGNLEPSKVKLEFEPAEFYALQSIMEQWYSEHHLDAGHYTSLKNKVANNIRHTDVYMMDGTLTYN